MKAPKPLRGQHHQITIQNPLIRHSMTPSPHAWEWNNEGSYLEDH